MVFHTFMFVLVFRKDNGEHFRAKKLSIQKTATEFVTNALNKLIILFTLLNECMLHCILFL